METRAFLLEDTYIYKNSKFANHPKVRANIIKSNLGWILLYLFGRLDEKFAPTKCGISVPLCPGGKSDPPSEI